MARQQRTRSLALALSLLVTASPAALAQKKKAADAQDVPERERTVKKEKSNMFKKWIDEDVAYIITDEEKKAWKKLATDAEREQFIEAFWRRRDPDPDTELNEYLEEHYERVAYANQHFASGIPGWKTDRGRIYIMYGPPHEKESHPAGGSYERPSYEGGGNTTTYPFEVWFYRYLPGIGSGIEIEFVDPTGTGEFRIARSPDEKDAMLMIPGAGLTLMEQLGLSSKTDRVTNRGALGYTGPGRVRQPLLAPHALHRLAAAAAGQRCAGEEPARHDRHRCRGHGGARRGDEGGLLSRLGRARDDGHHHPDRQQRPPVQGRRQRHPDGAPQHLRPRHEPLGPPRDELRRPGHDDGHGR